MKPFSLEEALAGEPVKLRDGSKAYVKYVMPDDFKGNFPLRGFYCRDISDTGYEDIFWTKEGSRSIDYAFISDLDIIGMWEEPRPRVLLDLPCPLKAPQEGMCLIDANFEIHISNFDTRTNYSFIALEQGRYFATKEDAQEWIDAMRNARR